MWGHTYNPTEMLYFTHAHSYAHSCSLHSFLRQSAGPETNNRINGTELPTSQASTERNTRGMTPTGESHPLATSLLDPSTDSTWKECHSRMLLSDASDSIRNNIWLIKNIRIKLIFFLFLVCGVTLMMRWYDCSPLLLVPIISAATLISIFISFGSSLMLSIHISRCYLFPLILQCSKSGGSG